jgi:acyl transferase domain-containing protein/NADPH:quinone reductase-like Zn-dependent oxidoreductase/NAD(P)-dependent dehydrogenase (short-subunit alcohol dehydrogenase family)/acyl carrier protein
MPDAPKEFSLFQNVAITGLSLRFPGDVSDVASFWEALIEGTDLVTEVDGSRWAINALQHPKRKEPGRSVTFSAGVLSRIDAFDAGFFGISPREAELLDPQQRLLLELAWEAMENAQLRPSTLAGSDCGVFVGISGLDYGMRLLDDLSSMGAHSMTGNTLSVAANRLSYAFDLHGPSMAIDTACSSSLVALHQACMALATGQASMALAGGVNLLLHPYPFVGFTKASMLSARGRCRAFAEGADGYVRAEGAAMLLLKPLHQAERDGDPIWGVIRASGVNADGARKTGLTIPSSTAQAELMQRVLQHAGLRAEEIDYLEAHGTGTRIGDPIEARAIGEVYGAAGQRAQPLPIGSVKSNLGHMEPASGMAGLLKALLTLRHHTVPPSLHAQVLNPDIDFKALNLQVAQQPMRLQDGNRPLRAGVNSFGFGGVNAHVILEEYRPQTDLATTAQIHPLVRRETNIPMRPAAALPLVLSARDEGALRELARRYLALLNDADTLTRARIAQAAWEGRDWLDHRLAVPDLHAPDALSALRAYAEGDAPTDLLQETALTAPGKLAWVYSGNGAQWCGMGRKLMASCAVFRQALRQAAAAISRHDGPDIEQVLLADDASLMDDTALAQPALFAVQVAMTALLRSQGLQAQAACGHSVGEIAAAWAVGALDLDAAARVIVARSKAQARTRGTGRMAAVGLGFEAMRDTLARLQLDDLLEIAAVNSPRNVTVSGPKEPLDTLREALQPQSVFFRELDLDYAFHSRLMDPIREDLLADLASLAPKSAPSGQFYSTVSGTALDASALDATYWWRNVREPVQFGPAIARLAADGYTLFLEIGPHAILQRYIDEALQADSHPGRALPTARREADDVSAITRATLRAALLGAAVDARAFFPDDRDWKNVQLPTYPWQRKRYWAPPTPESYALIERDHVHPLLGYRLKELPAAWENHLDPLKLPWLADHQVGHATILPGAAYLEMALAAARAWFDNHAQPIVDHLEILSPVVFDGEHAHTVRVVLDAGHGRVRIEGRRRLSQDAWALHARCQVREGTADQTTVTPRIPAPGPQERRLQGERLYAIASAMGLDYGPAFRGLHTLDIGSETLQAELSWDAPTHAESGYVLHPTVLDPCFQATFGWFEAELAHAARPVAFLPVGMERVTVHHDHVGALATRLRARLVRRSPHSVLADFELLDAEDRLLASARGVRFRAAALTAQPTLPQTWVTQARLTPLEGDPVASAPLPSPEELAQSVQTAWTAADRRVFTHFAEELAPLVDALPAAFARDALQALVQPSGSVAPASIDSLRASHPLWSWCLTLLQDEGVLEPSATHWTLRTDALPPTAAIWQAALIECPQAWPELLRMARIGEHLAQMATAEGSAARDTLTSLPPVAPTAGLPWYAAADQAVLHALRALVRQWPRNRRLRVLDISTRDASLLDPLMADLAPDHIEIVHARPADAALALLQAAREGQPCRSVVHVDPARLVLDGAENLPQRFDVVLLDHVLHATPAPAVALAEVAARMAPDALMLVTERGPDRASSLLVGTAPDSWQTAEDGRLIPSLMSSHHWTEWLQQAGWQQIQTLSDPVAGAVGLGSFVVLARPPAQVSDEVLASPVPRLYALLVQHPAGEPRARALASALHQAGARAQVLPPEALQAGTADALAGSEALIVFPHLPAPQAGALALAQALDALRRLLLQAAALESPPCVWLVTQGGALMPLPEEGGNPASSTASALPQAPQQISASALWGMVRVLRNEAPHLPVRLLALSDDAAATEPAQPDALIARLAHAVMHDDGEDETLLTAQARFAPRIQPVDLAALRARTQEAAEAWRLEFTLPGQLRNLHWQACPRSAPQGDEIEIEAEVAGLNFRDLMYAMGLLSDEALEQGFAGAALGLEVAGRVVRCGPEVTRFKPGDAVLAFAGASLASHVRVSERAAAHKPARWSVEQAATVPTVFFTVWYALVHLARLQAGERVLIHAAAGGVGLAAIQVAKLLGAEVFASAGNPDKRTFVRLLGADHVIDSRSADFDDAVLALTAGQGVDVVLNSLAGQAIERNLRVLRPLGRFVELGKRDFYEDTAIGLRPFRNNISYFGFDADQLMALRPDVATRVFTEIMEQFAQERLHPLPYTLFAAQHIVEALRHMQQGRHIGKLLIDLRQRPALAPAATERTPLHLDAQGAYLVTGGLSGFGLATARWLVEQGARHLVLLGRRGRATPGAEPALQALTEQGAQLAVLACDVTDADAVRQALAPFGHTLPPLRGIIHAAMVLDDALLPNLDAERFAAVLSAKLAGAQNLHQATLGMPLDFFVLYSSATVLLGNPGQANYVAANAALEAFARWRRSQGLPALAVAWGPIGDVGVLTDNTVAKEALASRLGAAPLQSAQALQALGQLLAQPLAHRPEAPAVMPLDAATLRRALPDAASRRFTEVWRLAGTHAGQADDSDLRAHLAQMPPEQARQTIIDLLAGEVAAILRLSVEAVPRTRSLHDLGLDSLMAVELGLALEKRFGVTLPAMLINDNPTVERIAERVYAGLFGEDAEQTSSTQTQLVQSMAAQHAEVGLDAQQVQNLVDDLHAKTQSATRLIA